MAKKATVKMPPAKTAGKKLAAKIDKTPAKKAREARLTKAGY